MAHFAKLDNNKVVEILVVSNNVLLDEEGNESEALGIQFCSNLLGGTWIQTSYTGSMRKNFAGVGYTYDPTLDAFIPPKPYDSWVLDTTSCKWEAPVAYPTEGLKYLWNEDIKSWEVENVN